VEGKSPKTIQRYKYILERMMNAIQIPTRQISVYDIRNYLSAEKQRGISDNTLEGIRQIFSAYFGWLHREGMITMNPVGNIGTIKHRKKVKDIFSEVDVELMKKACKTNRDLAIVTFLLSTGCRVSEMTGLNRNSVDLTKLECKVIGKGDKERIVYLSQVAGMFLEKYLNDRKDEDECLFRSKLGNRISTGMVRKMLKAIEKKSGVKNVHPHKFRRTLATNLIKHGMPIEEVAAILGHDKLDTTMQYVVLDKSAIKNAYQKCA
jgi:site-specific recombinase XerD